MYGDSYLPIRFRTAWDSFCTAGLPALMTVFGNAGRWDTSNVEFADGRIVRYDKVDRTPSMQHIDYGLGVLEASVLAQYPNDRAFDLAELYRDLSRQGRIAGCEVSERFYEIGSPRGLAETSAFLTTASASR